MTANPTKARDYLALSANDWLAHVHAALDAELRQALDIEDEQGLDKSWTAHWETIRSYVLRPAKRLRPALFVAGYELASGAPATPPVYRFAAGLELLHAFLLVHDDIADEAATRRGGPALHLQVGEGRRGENVAVVVGDHLYSRAVEVMLTSQLPGAAVATADYLKVCRHTAVGQVLDLELEGRPLGEVTLWEALKVAHLKTAKYGFVAPLTLGARLGGAGRDTLEVLERVGAKLGLAFQLRDDLIGLFSDEADSGKPNDSDIERGKRTFPMVAAYIRANDVGRRTMSKLLEPGARSPNVLAAARALLRFHGGEAATQRAIDRATRSATRSLAQLPQGPVTHLLTALTHRLATRAA